MAALRYWILRAIIRAILFCTIRASLIRTETARRPGPYILVCNHLSHLDPVCISAALDVKVDWMARIEFFRNWFSILLMKLADAFPVNRQGLALRGIKAALDRLRRGRVVGVFPEGEVTRGKESALRGGAIKKGAILLSMRTGVPILPCIILGTEELSTVRPWLPFRRGKLLLACGSFIHPHPAGHGTRKQVRETMACELQQAFVNLYAEVRRTHGIKDSDVP